MLDLYSVADVSPHPLASGLAGAPGVRAREHEAFVFANGNRMVRLAPEPPEPGAVLVLALARHSPGEVLLELGLLVDALRREHDAPIRCALPYLPYSRSNRLSEPHVSLGARVYARMLDSLAVDRLLLFDLHAPEVAGFFSTPVRQASAVPLVADDLARRGVRVDWVVAPDCGRADACRALAAGLGARADFFVKARADHGGGSSIPAPLRPHLAGGAVLLFDDEVTTGDTLVNAARAAAACGAAEIHAAVIHSLCGAAVLRRLGEVPAVRSFVTTNLALPLDEAERAGLPFEYRVLDCSALVLAAAGGAP
jgi:ribose-phosphate pyrophosphokinase